MKTIRYYRHGIKGGDGNLSSVGKIHANGEGWKTQGYKFDVFFWGSLPRTMQTCVEFITGWATVQRKFRVHGYIDGIGDDPTFKEMVTDKMKAAMATMTNIGALFETHVDTQPLEGWKLKAHTGLKAMFDVLEPGQVGAAFGHSPIIELVALGCRPTGDSKVVSMSTQLGELDFISFFQDDAGYITYTI